MQIKSLNRLTLCLCISLFLPLFNAYAQGTAKAEAGDIFAFFKSYKKGVELYDLGRYEQAVEEFNQAINLNPYDSNSYYNLGLSLSHLKQSQKAVVVYRKAILLTPTHQKAHLQLCATLAAVGRYWEAVDACRDAIKFNRVNATAYFHLGQAHNGLRFYSQAVMAFRLAIEHRRDFAEAHLRLGQTLYRLELYEESLDSIERARRLSPSLLEAKQELDRVAKILEHLDVERAALTTEDGYENLGDAFHRLGLFDKAVMAYRKALEKRAGDGELFYKLGLTFYNAAQYEEATLAYKQAIRFLPDPAKARKNLSWVKQLQSGKLLPFDNSSATLRNDTW